MLKYVTVTSVLLPEYENPPAIETAMGFRFAPLSGLNLLRLGQLWGDFRTDYPNGDLLEPVGDVSHAPQPFTNLNCLAARAMFSNPTMSELLQVQSTAFLRNWRRTPENKDYTHYAQLKPRFQIDWQKFLAFLQREAISQPSVVHCEVIYVNHLVRGKDWRSFSDLAKLIKLFAPRQDTTIVGRDYSYLPEAASVGLSVGYHIRESDVTLQFHAQSAITVPQGVEVLQLTITGKAAPKANSEDALSAALDRCHDAVILGFDDVLTDAAHELWGKQ